MKKNLFLLFLLFGGWSLSAQTGLLWKISGKDLAKPSYLFGTIHLICASDYFEPHGYAEAIRQSELICLEIDMTNPQLMAQMQQIMVDSQMRNIKAELPAHVVPPLDSLLRKNLMAGIDQVGILKPWAILSVLTASMILPCEWKKQYETELTMWARQEQKKVAGLETIARQGQVFDRFSRADQLKWLIELVETPGTSMDLMRRMVDRYKAEDLTGLLVLMEEQPEYRKYMDVLLNQRNLEWIEPMEQLMQQQSVFFGVGCGHLGGEHGVISLLCQKGYRVERVQSQ